MLDHVCPFLAPHCIFDINYSFAEKLIKIQKSDGCKFEPFSVVRTSYQTARGRLVQSILFPKPIDSRLNNDAISFVMLMGVIALIGFSYSVIMQYYGCVKTKEIILKLGCPKISIL